MSVLLICDLCLTKLVIEPGDISKFIGNAKGWEWYRPSGYSSQLIILPETVCVDCAASIKKAQENVEVVERAKLRANG